MTRPLQVVHLEPDASDATIVREALAAAGIACEVKRVDTLEAFVAALDGGEFDLILAECTLPSRDGLSALRIAQDRFAHLPFILVSATLDESLAVEAIKMGATDYVVKTRLARLARAVRRAQRDAAAPEALSRAVSTLRESELNARLIVDNIPGLVALLTPTGSIEMVNRQVFEYFGRTLDELKHWETNDTIHPDDLAHVREVFARAIASGVPYEVAQRFRRADGVYRWFTNRGFPVCAADGQVTRWCVLLLDIDERKRAEAAVDKARSDLAHVTRVATVNALTTSIAHEINQPVTGIVTNGGTCLRLLDADPPDLDGARLTATRMIRDANRTAEVIAGLRALFTNQEFSLEPLNLNEVTREVLALTSSDLQRNRVVLDASLAEDLPLIDGDRIQLQQVLLNLLRNAQEAMSQVHGRVRALLITTEREASGDVRLSVRDTGVGIDHEHSDTLFTAFRTTKPDGMGVGLSISRSIIARHQGRLWAESNDGPGATFAFSIPAKL